MKHARQILRVKYALFAVAVLGTIWLFNEATPERYESIVEEEVLTKVTPETKGETVAETRAKIDAAVEKVSDVTMTGPKYSGRDQSGRRWQIAASAARQVGDGYKQIELQDFSAQAQTSQNKPLAFGALYGLYDAENKKVVLTKNVRADFAGYKLETQAAHYYLKDTEAVIDTPLVISGPKGQVKAQRFSMTDAGKTMAFTGGVSVVFYPKKGKN